MLLYPILNIFLYIRETSFTLSYSLNNILSVPRNLNFVISNERNGFISISFKYIKIGMALLSIMIKVH